MKLTDKQIHDMADKIAVLVSETPVDQRHELYDMVSLKLKHRIQGYSAKLFEWVAYKDRNG